MGSTNARSTATARTRFGWALPVLAAVAAGACKARTAQSEAAEGSVVQAAQTAPSAEGMLPGAGGVSLHFRVLGNAPDTVDVVHGGPGAGMNSVLPDFAPLADSLTLVFYDQRGGGRSTLPADTATLDAASFVEDLEAVRRHFDLPRMRFLPHSFGSVLVARYAEAYPDHVAHIVLHGVTGPVRRAAARAATAAASSPDTARSRRAGELLGTLLDGSATDPVGVCREYESVGRQLVEARGDSGRWRGTTCDAPPDAVRYYYRYTAQLASQAFGDWDFTTGLKEVTAPAIADRPDVVLPAVRAFLRGAGPGGLIADTVMRSDRWPPAAIEVDPAFRHLGARSISLGSAEAEIHVLAEVTDGAVQRFYWIQFEGRPPESPVRYDYSNLPFADSIDGYAFHTDVRFGAYSEAEVRDETDTRTVGEILAAAGYDFPAPMMRARMVTLDETARNELLVIYMESLAWSKLTDAELEADAEAWARAAAGLRERAVAGLELLDE